LLVLAFFNSEDEGGILTIDSQFVNRVIITHL